MDGSIYGIPVPPNFLELEKLGAAWLTEAFQVKRVTNGSVAYASRNKHMLKTE